MFKFDFDVGGADEQDYKSTKSSVGSGAPSNQNPTLPQFSEVSLNELLELLPPLISYSPLVIPLQSGRNLSFPRRDLFDARFQVIAEGSGDSHEPTSHLQTELSSALKFLDDPSDLMPGVYEGGLKTWECSVDLVHYMDKIALGNSIRGKRVLEIGCGTALPSLYLLHELLASPPSQEDQLREETNIHMQDFNYSVLALMTLPNILLTWYASKSADNYRETEERETSNDKSHEDNSTLSLTPSLISAFLASMNQQNIKLRFISGSWDKFDIQHTGGPYQVVVTSETIYHTHSLRALTALLARACGSAPNPTSSEELDVSRINLSAPLCLVSAKVLYFGVGGGVSEFVGVVEHGEDDRYSKGKVETVWENVLGIGRKIMMITWE